MRARTPIVVAVALAAVAAIVLYLGTGAPARRVSRWCATQLSAISDAHIRPEFAFETITYQPPRTVTLTEVRLISEGEPIVTMDSVEIQFTEIPKRGRPIVMETLVFTDPAVRLIPNGKGGLLGFDDFLRRDRGQTRPDGGSTKLSEVLAINTISLVSGSVSFEPRGRPPMVLRPLSMDLTRKPAADESGGTGWYAFEAQATLDPLVLLHADAQFNIDNGDLKIDPLILQTELRSRQYSVFTPAIQEFLQTYEIVGTLDGSLSGLIALGDHSRSDFDFELHLADGHARISGFELPLSRLDIYADYQHLLLSFPKMVGQVFGGQARAEARFDFGQLSSPFWLQGSGSDLLLESLLSYETEPDTRPSGELSVQIVMIGQLDHFPDSLEGSGSGTVESGHLPMVSRMRTELDVENGREGDDRATGEFMLTSDRFEFENFAISGGNLAILGRGDVYYDGRLDLQVEARP